MTDELFEGQILAGKYRVDRVLARGGMGVVFVAHHATLRERVAIKVLDTTLLRSIEAIARFEREARLAVKIRSEHVAQIHDVGHLESGAPYIVMEYLEGEDLARRIAERGPLSVEEAVDFVLQAGVAVADAHAAGIVHRDLKPGNLVCVRRSDGRALVKVLDFGISKSSGDGHELDGVSATRTKQILGSPLYMSPEQVRSSRDVDARTDIWSLGAVLFELLTGKPPFVGETFGDVAVRISTQPPPSLASARPDAPEGLGRVIERCLSRDLGQRYSSMAELAQALLPFATEESRSLVARIQRIPRASGAAAVPQSAETSQPPPESWVHGSAPTLAVLAPKPRSASVRRAVLGGALLVAAGVVVIAALALRREEPVAGSPAAPLATAINAAKPVPAPAPAPVPSVAEVAPSSGIVVAPVPTTESSATPSATSTGTVARSPATANRPVVVPSASPPPIAKPVAKPRPECNPPYVLDERGRRHFKPECYLSRP